MQTDWASVATLAMMAVFFVYGVRRWNGPAQDARLMTLKDEVQVVRGNHKRLERDFIDFQSMQIQTQEELLREVRAIAAGYAGSRTVGMKIDDLADRVTDLEQMISSLPCGETGRTCDVAPRSET